MSSNFIPISQPSITDLEIKYVTDAVSSTWVSSLGKYIDRFEETFAAFCRTKYAISVSSGTAAIHLSLKALGVGQADEVIVPDLSFIATANSVLNAGGTPVFADVDAFNLCLDPSEVERLVTERTKAIMPVHLYGHPAEMSAINSIAERYGLVVIEDAAESHGARTKDGVSGGLGFCGTFSFYGNKNLTTGEGGMITTNDEEFSLKCRHLRDHAMSKEKRYWHNELGFNYRLTNLQAALGCAQLERVDSLLNKRQEIFEWYSKYLQGVEGIQLNRTYDWAFNSYWLICMEVEKFDEQKRDTFIRLLKDEGVDSRPYFYPMSSMPYFAKANTPVSYEVYGKGLNLPTYFDLQEKDVERIALTIKNLL